MKKLKLALLRIATNAMTRAAGLALRATMPKPAIDPMDDNNRMRLHDPEPLGASSLKPRVNLIGRAISVRPAPQPSNIPNFVLRGIRLPLSAAHSPSSAQGGTRWSGGAHVLSWAIQ
jgi:hypothetical protein